MRLQKNLRSFAFLAAAATVPAVAEGAADAASVGSAIATIAPKPPPENRFDGDVPADAREDELSQVFSPAREAVRLRQNLITPFYAYYAQLLPTTISSGGKIAGSTYGGGCSWRYVEPDKTRVALTNFNYRRTDFRFSGTREPAPFEHTDLLSAMTYHEFINPENGRALVAILGGALAAEDRADLNDGFGGFFSLAGKQYFSEETSCMLGASVVYSPLRERFLFYPVFSFDWKFAKNFNLRILNGAELTWDVGGKNEFLLDFSVLYESSAFAVAAESDAADRHAGEKGAYAVESVPVTLAGTWNLSENFFLGAQVSLVTWSKYREYRDGSKTGEKFSTDPGVSFSVQVGFRF